MPAAKTNLPTIEQGATYIHSIQWFQSDGVTPVNLVNCSAKMQIRTVVTDPTVIIELSTSNNRLAINAVLGRISLYIAASDTLQLPSIKGAVYDLEVYFPEGTITRLIEGKVNISPEVTRDV